MSVAITQHPRLAIKQVLAEFDGYLNQSEFIAQSHNAQYLNNTAYLQQQIELDNDIIRKAISLLSGKGDETLIATIRKAAVSKQQPHILAHTK